MSKFGVFSGPFCPVIRTEYGDLRSKFPYSVRMQENADQKKLRIWTLFTQRTFCYQDIQIIEI